MINGYFWHIVFSKNVVKRKNPENKLKLLKYVCIVVAFVTAKYYFVYFK